MKRIILILLFGISMGNIVQAQFLKNIKAKAKAAIDNSVDRSTNKVIDKAINNPMDNATDTVLAKSGRKVSGLFKKKKDKNDAEPVDSAVTVVPVADTVATRPRNQN